MKRPDPDDMRLAAEWLDMYEPVGDPDDGSGCTRVRDWLLAQAQAAELRTACREVGIPVRLARERLYTRKHD